MHSLLSKKNVRFLSFVLSIALVLQVSAGVFYPMISNAAPSTADNKITFSLPKDQIQVKVNGDFNSWGSNSSVTQTVYNTTDNGAVTYHIEIVGLPANTTYGYKFQVNGNYIEGSNLSIVSDDNGKLEFSYTPVISVYGNFDNNWGTRQPMTLVGNNFEYTTGILADGVYEYKFIAKASGQSEAYFKDPTNPDSINGNSKFRVGVAPDIKADVITEQPGGDSVWYVTGLYDWNNANPTAKMKHLVGEYYVYSVVLDQGHYEFKYTKNGTWDGYAKGLDNFAFDLTETTKVNFYVNDELKQARISIPNVAGLQQYTPALSQDKWPRLVGNIQTALGEAEWSPSAAQQFFVDYNFNNTIYKLQRSIPIGSYAAKVVFGSAWTDENYGNAEGGDLLLVTLDPADVSFSIDYSASKKALSHNYKPADGKSDGLINKSAITFDSRSITYKKPFGAIAENSQDLTLRIAAEKDDVQIARVELINANAIGATYDMRKVTTVGDKDYFEAVIPKADLQGIGIWGYKFILVDGSTKLEYGDDGVRGGSGLAQDEGVVPFDLTVYDGGFQTPDWMKNAIVYQIFPDRFFDGDKTNNRAKVVDGYRGDRSETNTGAPINNYPLQYFDGGVANDPAPSQVWGSWSDIPERPDRTTPENKPYFPNAKTDGVWTNEFYGGDIQGVQQKLDYLVSLGVKAIYFNPIAWAGSNHKYDATDYKHLDPMFGKPVYNTPGDPTSGLNYEATRIESDKIFIQFANAARAKGLHLIMDGVFNHVGDDSIYFDRYEKYPEIGAYEYWAAVWDKVNASGGKKSQATAEQEVRDSYTSKINPATGVNYKYPEDFEFTTWFKVENEKVNDRDSTNTHYKYDAWWGYDSLPAMEAKEPAIGDADALSGVHEWNSLSYREHVIGTDLSGKTASEAEAEMKATASQRWNWMGASGWRLDVAPDVSQGTWQKFREAVKSTEGLTNASGQPIDEPIILGEEWGVATHYLLGDQFDSVMNYRFRGALQSYLTGGNAQSLHQALESIREDYPAEAWQVMLNLVGSHDTTRNITKLEHKDWEEQNLAIAPDASDNGRQLQALTAIFQMGYPGAPTIYYGDEVGMEGTKDPDSRRSFPWERVTGSDGSYQGTGKYADLFEVYTTAASIRNNNDVFRTGDLKMAYAEGDVIAYARKNATKAGLVVINKGTAAKAIEANVAGYLPDGITLTDQLNDAHLQATVAGGKISITVPARTGLMMVSDGTLVEVPLVSNVVATAGNGSVTLTWDAVAGADGYNVYRAPIEGGTLTLIANDLTTLTHTDTSVTNGIKYYYAVTAKKGTGESLVNSMAAATPSFPIQSVVVSQTANDMTIGFGKKTSEIQVTIDVPGLTDDADYANAEAPNMTARLAYYLNGTDKADAIDAKLRFKQDSSGKKIYYATFEPTEAGTYRYFAKISTDNGETFTESAEAQVTANADSTDTTPPATPVMADILVESNRVYLEWTASGSDIKGFEVYRKKASDSSFKKLATLEGTADDYIDYTVNNDTQYVYKVAAFDQAYNRVFSGEKSVTPKLVMVDVTLRLHLPSYTPATDDIYLAGTINGWTQNGNKLTVPSGATNRDVVEYTFKMMAGKIIEYKYTRGTWSTEAFTSHTRVQNDTTDEGNWAYSSTDTNMKLTIKNQGGNKMLVDDYVLRWVDMPMMISMPRISYGEDIAYSTPDSSFKLKAVVPYGVQFTINGQPIAANQMDAYGNVEVDAIPLVSGVNNFAVHIEPTAETLNLPWYTDKGRAGQATKTINLTITRTTSDSTGSTPDTGSKDPAAPGDKPGKQVVNAESLKPNKQGKVAVEIANNSKSVLLPAKAAEMVGAKPITLESKELTAEIAPEVLTQLQKLVPAADLADAQISFTFDKVADTVKKELLDKAKAGSKADVKEAGEVYEFNLSIVTKDGKETKLTQFDKPIKLTLKVNENANKDLLGIYFVADDGKLTYVGGKLENGMITADIHHFSKYAVLEINKTYADVPAKHWASDVIKRMSAKQIAQGMSETEFAPDRQVTRAEFASMLVRALGLPAEGAAPFTDVNASKWYAASVAAAHKAGIISGQNGSLFAPERTITREEMAVMMVRAFEYQQGKKTATAKAAGFKDQDQISGWASKAVNSAFELGFVNGRGNNAFAPKGKLTRAEAIQAISKLIEN